MSPNGLIDDGLMDLLAVYSGGRMKMVKFLVGMRRHGDHVNQSNLMYVKVRAVCIEPETTHWFNVDGEPYQCDRLVIETMSKRVTYMGGIE
jgi:diacylglycerol kinase family enzyme